MGDFLKKITNISGSKDDKNVALYNSLFEEGLYTKTYSEFRQQFANHEKLAVLFSAMKQDGLYTKTEDDFKNQFFPQISDMAPDNTNYGSISISDQRNIDPITGEPISDTNRLHSKVDVEFAKQIIEKAKKNGVDPYTALAIVNQETGFSNDYMDNPFRVSYSNIDEKKDLPLIQNDPIDFATNLLKNKLQLAERLGKKTEAEKIQAWNGYGKVGKSTEGTQNKMYGIDVTKDPIDMNTNPVYGKRIIDIRDNILKQNPEIVNLVNQYGIDKSDNFY